MNSCMVWIVCGNMAILKQFINLLILHELLPCQQISKQGDKQLNKTNRKETNTVNHRQRAVWNNLCICLFQYICPNCVQSWLYFRPITAKELSRKYELVTGNTSLIHKVPYNVILFPFLSRSDTLCLLTVSP